MLTFYETINIDYRKRKIFWAIIPLFQHSS
jgi:hypothetical protein